MADVGGRVQQLLDVVDHTVQLEIRGHHVLSGPEDKDTHRLTRLHIKPSPAISKQ